MLGTVFRVRFSVPGLESVAQSVLAHLAAPDNQAFDVTLDVQQDSLGCFLFCNGELVDHCTSEEELAPLLHGRVLLNAYSRTDCLTAIHAAAVSNDDTCIVFPASSGSGKSTLTAALIASGFQYCTDELVLLKHHTHTIQAAPSPGWYRYQIRCMAGIAVVSSRAGSAPHFLASGRRTGGGTCGLDRWNQLL